MRNQHDPRLASSNGPSLTDLGHEARASVALILVTLAVVLTISFIGLALA